MRTLLKYAAVAYSTGAQIFTGGSFAVGSRLYIESTELSWSWTADLFQIGWKHVITIWEMSGDLFKRNLAFPVFGQQNYMVLFTCQSQSLQNSLIHFSVYFCGCGSCWKTLTVHTKLTAVISRWRRWPNAILCVVCTGWKAKLSWRNCCHQRPSIMCILK